MKKYLAVYKGTLLDGSGRIVGTQEGNADVMMERRDVATIRHLEATLRDQLGMDRLHIQNLIPLDD